MESLCHHSHEEVVLALQNPANLQNYKLASEGYQAHWLPKAIGQSMVFLGNFVYGKSPSYGKFKAIEVIARIPYQSWEVVSYMLLTFFYANEAKAIELSRTSRFSRAAQDNETMHVIVISQLAKKHAQNSFFLHTFIPLVFSFFYFTASFILYLLHPRYSFQLNYVFECHAFLQYQKFLDANEEALKSEPILCDFLSLYGRYPKSEYEFFHSILTDELIHRHQSYLESEKYNSKKI